MNTATLNDYQYLQDLSTSLSLSNKKNRRVQLKMPSMLVDMLDKAFPNVDRSTLLTQAVTDLLLRKNRVTDPTLEGWVAEEQYIADEMETYLNEREKDV